MYTGVEIGCCAEVTEFVIVCQIKLRLPRTGTVKYNVQKMNNDYRKISKILCYR